MPQRTPTALARPPHRPSASSHAARSLFLPTELSSHPAAAPEPALLQLKRVVGFSGDQHGLLVWLQEAGTILYAVAALLVLQVFIAHACVCPEGLRCILMEGLGVSALNCQQHAPAISSCMAANRHRAQDIDTHEQKILIGHTANVCALSAASSSPLVASAQEFARRTSLPHMELC